MLFCIIIVVVVIINVIITNFVIINVITIICKEDFIALQFVLNIIINDN